MRGMEAWAIDRMIALFTYPSGERLGELASKAERSVVLLAPTKDPSTSPECKCKGELILKSE